MSAGPVSAGEGGDEGIRSLLDRAAIGDVILRYAQCLDRRTFEQLRGCFTADAQATYSGVDLEPGVDHIITHVSRLSATLATTHVMGPSLIERDGDGADVLTPAIVYIDDIEAGVETVRTRGLRYQDRFVRVDGGWLIRRRVHTVDWMYSSPGRPTTMTPASPPAPGRPPGLGRAARG